MRRSERAAESNISAVPREGDSYEINSVSRPTHGKRAHQRSTMGASTHCTCRYRLHVIQHIVCLEQNNSAYYVSRLTHLLLRRGKTKVDFDGPCPVAGDARVMLMTLVFKATSHGQLVA